uniref:Replication termination factor 2 n=1 Tax=Ditylenchus dipsaci TaxID=166011 RepID=A0A915EA49_9BILA
MGADGGTIPKRCELVRNKKKKEKIDKNVAAAVIWRTCQLTQLPLKKPIVACKLGRLYNKEAIIEAKLNKKLHLNETTKHIKTLSDVKELRLTDNKAWKDSGPDKGDTYMDFNESPYVCPVTAMSMNGTNGFTVNWNCGCVVSEKAINELKLATCNGCGGPFVAKQIISLYPDEELLARAAAIEEAGPGKVEQEKLKSKKVESSVKSETGLKRKAETSSIQDDPNVSKAVKSLFTTSEAAKKQPAQHWVTHNPCFY